MAGKVKKKPPERLPASEDTTDILSSLSLEPGDEVEVAGRRFVVSGELAGGIAGRFHDGEWVSELTWPPQNSPARLLSRPNTVRRASSVEDKTEVDPLLARRTPVDAVPRSE